MEGEIVRAEQHQGQRALITREQLRAEVEQRQLLGEYVKSCMVKGTDFGVIPGTDKPALLKPGAEKLIALFHCSPEFEFIERLCHEDFKEGFFKYTLKCRIISPRGGVVAEGVGSANSREKRYRWRDATRKCPSCGKAAIIKGKAEYGGGWVCFKKKDGCGEKFGDTDPLIVDQQQGRVENEDIADLDNTILKMAKKRAQVDAAIALARCSDMFTQDLEDFTPGGRGDGQDEAPPPAAPPPPAPGPVVVAFGPHKGKRAMDLNDEELSETIELAHEKLVEQPKAKWAKAMRENLAVLEAEESRRSEKDLQEKRRPGGAPLLTADEAAAVDRSKVKISYGKLGLGRVITDLGVDEIGHVGEEIQGLLKGKEGMRWANKATNQLLLLGLELESRMAKSAQAEKEEARANMRKDGGP